MPKLVDGQWIEPVWLYRFLFENGDVLDIEAIRDDSTLRGAILMARRGKVTSELTPTGKVKEDRIAGSTRVRFVGYPEWGTKVELVS